MKKADAIKAAQAAGWEYVGQAKSGRHEFARGDLTFSFNHNVLSHAGIEARFKGRRITHDLDTLLTVKEQYYAVHGARRNVEKLTEALNALAALDRAAVKAQLMANAREVVEAAHKAVNEAVADLVAVEAL